MGIFRRNHDIKEEENGELKKSLAELECEEAIINDKKDYGRVRNSMMRVLRARYGYDSANRALSRVNKRFQEGYFKNTMNKTKDYSGFI